MLIFDRQLCEALASPLSESPYQRTPSRVRYPPRSGWLDELDRLKGGFAIGLGVALKRAVVNSSERPACSIRVVLFADVLADLLQLKSNRGNGIAASPEMLACEVPFLAAQAGNRNCTLPFQKPDHGCHGVLRGNLNAHVHVVRHEVSFYDLALFLPRQSMEYWSQLPTRLPEYYLAAMLGHEHHMILAVPLGVG